MPTPLLLSKTNKTIIRANKAPTNKKASISLQPKRKTLYFVLFALGSYPLTSIALDSSSLLSIAETNRGMIKEIMALNLLPNPPRLKSTPRLACAFIILSDSSKRVGMNLRAIDKVIATA